ncbi:hypothetical protein M422DRAFT_276578 [Sphaerobolus stellatus SS14]|uniref:Uncharacterized protein n=1 Tax=Sphaerobolus stellatus (strain SS14) TaxID=990650 RepID=A0A0C9U1Q5_SPHS4|nr:hypothetical protein M422DRAFT_276578 [Sphaerobolus stellatus SS14]
MSLPVVRKFTFSKKSSSISQILNNRGDSRMKQSCKIGGDWIDHALNIARLTTVAVDTVPIVGGLIKGASAVFNSLIESIQQMGRNKENCKVLITSIAQLLEIVNLGLKTLPSIESLALHSYSNAWTDFERPLENTKESLVKLNSEARFLLRYIFAEKIGDIISSSQAEIQRPQNNLLLANILPIRVQISNQQARMIMHPNEKEQAHGGSKESLDLDDPGDIHLMQTLSTSRDTTQESIATVYCGGIKRSVMVRMYKGNDAQTNDLGWISGTRHANVLQLRAVCKSRNSPALIFDDVLLSVPQKTDFTSFAKLYAEYGTGRDIVSELLRRYRQFRDVTFLQEKNFSAYRYQSESLHTGTPVQIDMCEYQSVDNRSVIAISFKELVTKFFTLKVRSFAVPEEVESSFSDDLFRQIEHPKSIHHYTGNELISMLKAFYYVIPSQFCTVRSTRNIFLGGITVRPYFPSLSKYQIHSTMFMCSSNLTGLLIAQFTKGIVANYSDWRTTWHEGESVDKIYRTKHTAKGIRICFTHDQQKIGAPDLYSAMRIEIPGRDCDTSHLLFSQINALVAKVKNIPKLIGPYGSEMRIADDEMRWHVIIKLPDTSINRRDLEDIFPFIEDSIIDQSGCLHNPNIYWSTCPSGTTALTVLQAYSFGIAHPHRLESNALILRYAYHPEKDVLKYMNEACGLKAESDEISKLMGYPLPDHKRFGHELLYWDFDIQPLHEEMPRNYKFWHRGHYSAKGTYIPVDGYNFEMLE